MGNGQGDRVFDLSALTWKIAVHWYSADETVEEGGWPGVEAAVGGFGCAVEGGGDGEGVCG